MSGELPLADLLPLWRLLRDDGVTALVTPSLDYVGALELSGVDISLLPDGHIDAMGEGLRSLVSALEDGTTLSFLKTTSVSGADAKAAYLSAKTPLQDVRHSGLRTEALEAWVQHRAQHLGGEPFRQERLYLFFSPSGSGAPRAPLGVRLPFASEARASAQHHDNLQRLIRLRNVLLPALEALGMSARELTVQELAEVHHGLLNPNRVADGVGAPRIVANTSTVPSPLSDAELLCLEDVEERKGSLVQGRFHRRVCTLKLLPEAGTEPFLLESLSSVRAPSAADTTSAPKPFPWALCVTLHIQPQGQARFLLSAQHGLVDALKGALPFLQSRSIQAEALDDAKQGSIRALFDELNALTQKLVQLQVSVLIDANSEADLDVREQALRAGFHDLGNAELLSESVSQLPAFLSMLPGGARYGFRKKACTSRNAADFIPLSLPDSGSRRASSVLSTPSGHAYRFDLFDRDAAPAHHGLVIADTGSGKSMAMGALTLDALASGADALLIDNGGSWESLTRVLGGTHLKVGLGTPLAPFLSFEEAADAAGHVRMDVVQEVTALIEVCLADKTFTGFDKLEADFVSSAVRRAYDETLRATPARRPLLQDFQRAIRLEAKARSVSPNGVHPDDVAIGERVARHLNLFREGLYAALLNAPSELRLNDTPSALVTFDLKDVFRAPITRAVAMATLMQAITHRAQLRRRKTLVEVDEGHEFLGNDDATERFLGNAYRKMRKADVAMWMVSQRFSDFAGCKAGPAILGNSATKLLLRHASGHDEVADALKLTPRAANAFRALSFQKGAHSDALLLHGIRSQVVRFKLDALTYWLLTTAPDDLKRKEAVRMRNPHATEIQILRYLAGV